MQQTIWLGTSQTRIPCPQLILCIIQETRHPRASCLHPWVLHSCSPSKATFRVQAILRYIATPHRKCDHRLRDKQSLGIWRPPWQRSYLDNLVVVCWLMVFPPPSIIWGSYSTGVLCLPNPYHILTSFNGQATVGYKDPNLTITPGSCNIKEECPVLSWTSCGVKLSRGISYRILTMALAANHSRVYCPHTDHQKDMQFRGTLR